MRQSWSNLFLNPNYTDPNHFHNRLGHLIKAPITRLVSFQNFIKSNFWKESDYYLEDPKLTVYTKMELWFVSCWSTKNERFSKTLFVTFFGILVLILHYFVHHYKILWPFFNTTIALFDRVVGGIQKFQHQFLTKLRSLTSCSLLKILFLA